MKTQPFILSTIIFACYILLLSNQLFSKEVDLATIKNVALNVYTERAENPIAGFNISHILEHKEKGETVFYTVIFSGKGFALISADDIVQPVLGYSFESEWDENNHSPAFKFYILERFKKQIYIAKQAKLLPNNETILEWQNYSVSPTSFQPKNVKSSTPLIETEWGQNLYYNSLCPEDPSDTISGHVPVGCVATAMAQVLNYWQHPWHGTGSHSYTPEDHPEYGEQSANFDTTLYNFDNMPNFPNNHSTDLAELMYHCAVSVNMNFGPDGSGAWGWIDKDEVSDALINHFYFNSNTEGIRRSTYPITWVDKMKENLDANRPVIYGAEDNQEDVGHAWILDAYTTGDMFHCNWGWSGSDNGWYSINDFSPDTIYTFDVYETATVKIYPHAGNLSGTWDVAGSPYYLDHDYIINASDQLNIEPGVEIIYNGRYKIIVYGQLNAIGTETDSIKFTPEYPEIGWRGTWFYNTNDNVVDTSKIKYCVLNNGNAHHTDYPGNIYRDGGALMCSNSSKVEVSDCTFKYNKAYSHGGSIACVDSSNILIKDCLISHSEARTGGGIYVFQSRPVITKSTIHNNYATEFGGGLHGYYSNLSLNHSELYLNSSQYGGAIELSNCYAEMDSVILRNNSAEAGGAILINNSTAELLNCEVKSNSATLETGGVQGNPSSIIYIEKMLNYGNTGEMGGGLGFWTCNPTITKSTIYNNNATDGAGIYLHNCSANISDAIIWNNSPDQVFDDSGTNSITYSNIEGGFTGTGNVNADPLFANETWYDLSLTWPDYPIPDGNKSPAIDSGNPASPFDPDGTRADMGAIPYEQTYTAIAGGTINGTLTCAESPYYINGDLEILATDELIIEPCVTIIFQGYYELEVRGRLHAVGTESQQITFAAADTLEGWKGIRFVNTNSNGLDSCKLVHCRVTFGNAHGSQVNDSRGGGAFFSGSSNVVVNNCLFNKNRASNLGGAIYVTGTYGPLIENNIFENNYAPNGGAILGLYTNLTLSNNLFQNNNADRAGAIYCHTSNFTFEGNTIRNNRAEFLGGGIYFEVGGTHTFDPVNKNSIYLNYAAAAGLDLYSTQSGSTKNVIVDTFTVQNPNKHFAWPLDKYTFSVDNHIIEQSDNDLYVSMTGDDENTGTSESDALKTMYMACLKIIADETNPHTIYLLDGTYSEGATGEVFPINWRSYVSMKGTSIEGTTIYGENKNQLLFCWDDSGFSIDSLTFQGGYGEYGGAIRLENESSPFVSNIEVMNNYAFKDGGGIFCGDHSSPVFSHISVHDNTSDVDGGGIKCYNYSNASILNSMFYDNFALYRGGGINIHFYSNAILDSLTIVNNTGVHGGGVFIYWDSDVRLSNSTIQGNDALSHVMGYFGTGGGIWTSYYSDAIFENLEITFNHADSRGGGMYYSGGIGYKVYNCFIDHNTSKSGGGIYLYGGTPHFYNSIISNNQTTEGPGGGIYSESSNPVFTNITIIDNNVISNGYTYYGGALYNFNSNPIFKNSILWGNTPNEIEVVSGSPTLEYCNIEGSYAGTGNIAVDPQLQTTINGIYDLGESSPCINTGTPDTTGLNLPLTDFAGNDRIYYDRIDMGAYEYYGFLDTYEMYLTVFLEGPFNGTDMNAGFDNIPLLQPYNAAPWNYMGTESVSSISPNVVDWILVELRLANDTEDATPETMIARQAALLLSDGTAVGLDGISPLIFFDNTSGIMNHVVVWHRNHLGIISSFAYNSEGCVSVSPNFTSETSAYDSEFGGFKELGGGIWGMVASDANADGTIDILDKNLWGTEAGESQYLNSDFNLDGQINNKDKNDYWQINLNDSSQVPE